MNLQFYLRLARGLRLGDFLDGAREAAIDLLRVALDENEPAPFDDVTLLRCICGGGDLPDGDQFLLFDVSSLAKTQ